MPRPFFETLRELRKGKTLEDLTAALSEMVTAVQSTGKGGEIVLRLRIRPPRKGSLSYITIEDEVVTKAPKADRISSFNEAMRLIESGYHLRGAVPDYWLEKPDGSDKRGVWLNAARACLKSGLEPIGDDQAGDEVGRWKWRGKAA